MASIVTPAYVREVISTEKCDDEISAHISAASSLVNNLPSMRSIPEDLLVEVKRWLAAHFLSLSDAEAFLDSNIKSREIGSVKIEYKDTVGDRMVDNGKRALMLTRWGRQAIVFDTTGTLAKLGGTAVKLCAV